MRTCREPPGPRAIQHHRPLQTAGNLGLALLEILRGIEDESRKLTLVRQLARIPHPALTRFNVETLRGDADERARANAAVALGARVNEPDVRSALEYARVSDPSPLVREMATRSLSAR